MVKGVLRSRSSQSILVTIGVQTALGYGRSDCRLRGAIGRTDRLGIEIEDVLGPVDGSVPKGEWHET